MASSDAARQDNTIKARRILDAAMALPAAERFAFIQGALHSAENEVLEDLVLGLALVLGLGTAPVAPRPQVVVLVHGIRTQAVWQEPLARLLNGIPGVTTRPIRYGFFDTVRFLSPVGFRKDPINHLERQLRVIASEHYNARISVVAHSFGTYAISKVLLGNPDIKLHRLILCGCVVPARFRWDRVANQIEQAPIINECGTNDIWPVLAKAVTWGYGASGTFGFQQASPLNRYYPLNHSGFFSESFYKAAWLPLFASPNSVPALPGSRPVSPGYFVVVDILPIRWVLAPIVVVMLTVALGWTIYFLDGLVHHVARYFAHVTK